MHLIAKQSFSTYLSMHWDTGILYALTLPGEKEDASS